MNESAISWTKVTWNPVHGCHKVSEGCRNCYAETLSLRRGWTTKPWTKPNAPDNVMLKAHKLREPYRLKEPSRIFVNSMSDLFHRLVPDDYIAQVFQVMVDLPQHTFQVLTKRPQRAAAWDGPWPANVWMGVSVEDHRVTDRIDALRYCPARVKFISYEPALGPLGDVDLTGYHWLIVGGESGPGHRDLDMAWARHARDLAVRDGLAFFFKQDSGYRTELRPWLVEEDGSRWHWEQFPCEMTPPWRVGDPRPEPPPAGDGPCVESEPVTHQPALL